MHKQDSAGASTPEGAMMLPGRACVVRGSRDRLHYLVIDGQLPKTAFKYHADHVIVGQSQMGGCPSEFVDCWNLVIDQRLQAAISPRLVCHAGASTPSS